MAAAVTAPRVAVSFAHLVPVKVIEGLVSMLWIGTVIAMMWIKTVIHMAKEAISAMEPRADSDEDAPVEPLRPVIPVWGAVVWGKVEVAVGANWLHADIDGNAS